MKKLFAVFLLSTNLFANFDLNMAAGGRSVPGVGGSLYLETGFNFVFWEQNKEVLYGLIRPAIYLDSSLVINTYGAKIGFYPVSFFGVEVGQETTDSQYNKYVYTDCEVSACEGVMSKTYVTGKLGLSAGPLVATAQITKYDAEYDYDKQYAPVAEFLYALMASAESDSIYYSRYVLGIKALGGFIGVVSDYAQMTKSTESFNSTYMIYGYRVDPGSISIGVGNIESDNVSRQEVIYARWSFWPFPTRQLF